MVVSTVIPNDELKKHCVLIYPSSFTITQGLGDNAVSFYQQLGLKGHNGIDIGCPSGSTVIAPCKLEITQVVMDVQDPNGYGTVVRGMTEPFLYNSRTYRLEMVFGHLQSYSVTLGQIVERGQHIAISDNTGKYTTGAHLHWGVRLVKKMSDGGWQAQDLNNGYTGYFDQTPLIDYKAAFPDLDNKIVYSGNQNGAMHYLFTDGRFYWVPDEMAFAIGGFLFTEAVQIPAEWLGQAQRDLYKVDTTSRQYKIIKQYTGLLVGNPARAKLLNNNY